MDGFWLDPTGAYYQGDQASAHDVAVPQRPDATYQWNGTAWVQDPFRAAQAAYAAAQAHGIALASTATPALNGTYPFTTNLLVYLEGLQLSIASGKGLPGGLATVRIYDALGAPHAFAAADVTNFTVALRDYVDAWQDYLAGQRAQAPASTLLIP